jgi:hypothetical protein
MEWMSSQADSERDRFRELEAGRWNRSLTLSARKKPCAQTKELLRSRSDWRSRDNLRRFAMPRQRWIVLPLVVSVTTVAAASREDGDRAPKWSVMKTPFYQIYHVPDHEADAKKARTHLNNAIEGLKKEFEGQPVNKLLADIDCKVYLHPKATDSVSEGLATLRTEVNNDKKFVATIDWLTLSAFRKDFRNSIGEPGGEDYFAKVLVHEYATILLERITRAKAKGWRYYDAQHWFVQGYEEYLGLTQSTPHNRKEVLAKYVALQKDDPRRVRIGFGIGVRDDYIDGAVLVHFMHETFGKKKVQAILTSEADTFEAAVGPALGVGSEEFGRRWEAWRKKLP